MSTAEWTCLAGALVLHCVGVPVAYSIAPDPPRVEYVRKKKPPSEYDVDLEDAHRVKPRSDNFGGQRAPLGMHDSRPASENFDPSKPITNNRNTGGNGKVGEGVLTGPDGPGQAGDNGGWYNPDGTMGNAPGPGEVWGIGINPDVPIWALNPDMLEEAGDGPAAPTRTKKRKYDPDAPTNAVADGVRAKDRKLGLDFPGRGIIKGAFVSATYSSDAPYECSATFGLAVNPKGKVTAVKYVTHSGGTAGTWNAVAKNAFGQLKSAKLIMKSAFKKGATVSVVVTSKKKTPGGGTSRDGATINFDVTDIGAKATRIVGASVVPIPVK